MTVAEHPQVAPPAWDRFAPLGGVVFVAIDVVVAALGGEPPASDRGKVAISQYSVAHRAGIGAGLWLFGIGMIALIWWSGGLWRWMVRTGLRQSGAAVASIVGLTIAGALSLAASAVWATLALDPSGAGDGIETLHALGAVLSSAAGIGLAAHLLATNIPAIRARSLPTWIVGIGIASAVGWLAQAIAASTSPAGATNPAGLVAFALWCLWILAVSRRLWRTWPELVVDPAG